MSGVFAVIKDNPLLLWLLSGIFLGVSLIVGALWWLVFLGAALFIYTAARYPKTAWWGGFLAFTVKYACTLSWFWSVYPFDWLTPLSTQLQLAIIAGYWILTSLIMGVGGVVVAVTLASLLRRLPTSRWLWLLVPMVWIGGEILVSLIFSMGLLGPGGSININFGFGYTGFALAESAMLSQLALVAGVYGMSMLVGLTGYALYRYRMCIQAQTRVLVGIISLLVVLVATAGVQVGGATTAANFRVVAIDTTYDPYFLLTEAGRTERQADLQVAVETALALEPDYVVLPEDAQFTTGFASEREAFAWIRESATADVVLIDSATVLTTPEHTVLRGFVHDLTDQRVHYIDKQYLVPQGEFVPHLYGWLMRRLGGPGFYESIAAAINYVPGEYDSYEPFLDSTPGVLFCFDSVNVNGVSNIMEMHQPPFIAHPLSHGWFSDPHVLIHQQDAMLAVQSVQHSIPIVSVGNMSPGQVFAHVDSYQTIVHEANDRYTVTEYRFGALSTE